MAGRFTNQLLKGGSMKKNFVMWRAAGLVVLCFALSGIANAGTINLTALSPNTPTAPIGDDPNVNVAFPTAGDAYCSATNGCGTIPLGGQTGYQWTANDYVISSVFTSTGLTSVTDGTADWTFEDVLGGGNNETWYVYVNGVAVAAAVLPDCDYCRSFYTVTGTVNFAGIAPVAGGYQVELVLQNTIPGGGGSVAWLDGGTTGLSGTATPEPSSFMLMGTFIAGLAMVLRRRLV
jgi:hypothetical protein